MPIFTNMNNEPSYEIIRSSSSFFPISVIFVVIILHIQFIHTQVKLETINDKTMYTPEQYD